MQIRHFASLGTERHRRGLRVRHKHAVASRTTDLGIAGAHNVKDTAIRGSSQRVSREEGLRGEA